MDAAPATSGLLRFVMAYYHALTGQRYLLVEKTQALAVATLGTARDEQKIDSLQGDYNDRFMLHYNMPSSLPAR